MRKLSVMLLSVLLVLVCSVSMAATPYDALDPVTLRFGNGTAIGAAGDVWGELFCKYASEVTGGKLVVDYFPNSQLGVDNEMLTQMQGGDLDLVACQPGQLTPFVPAVAVYDLPLSFAKYDAATIDRALNRSDFTELMDKEYAKSGMVCLGALQGATFRVMTSNAKIEKLADFKGIKIRTMNSPNHLAFWKALGANPTPLPFTELYMSLQQGTVVAQENANDTNLNMNFHEVQKFLVNTRHILYLNQLLINKERFESLDPAYQAAIKEAIGKATADIAPTLTKLDHDSRDKLVAGGMQDLTYDNAFYDEVIKAAQPVYADIRKAIGDEVVDSLNKALEGK
ncbi:ABC transporter substrate-binding protein [Synergistales bacterium]|nr:ABC transporter substrate-binding protein [Synergistales bacterium]